MARLNKSLLAVLGAAALIKAQDVSRKSPFF